MEIVIQTLELIVKYGISPVLMVAAIFYLNHQNDKANARADVERQQHRDERDKRITTCEQHILECNQDRNRMRSEFAEERNRLHIVVDKLQDEVRSLYKQRYEDERNKHKHS